MSLRRAFLFFGLSIFLTGFSSQYENLFSDTTLSPPLPAPYVIRAKYARLRQFVPLGSNAMEGAKGITLNLFDDTIFEAVGDRFDWRGEGRFTWYGQILGAPHQSQVMLTHENGIYKGVIAYEQQHFQITQVSGDIYRIEERGPVPDMQFSVLRPTATQLRDTGTLTRAKSHITPRGVPADDGRIVDVMVVYTDKAEAGDPNILTTIQAMVDQMNLAFSNSVVNTRARLVRAYKTSYSEYGDSLVVDITRLQSTTDGFLDEVHNERTAYGADVVTLLINNNLTGVLGIGFLNSASPAYASTAFSVVQTYMALDYYVYGHEVGHNMGCHHDRANASGSGAYSYSYGYYDGVAGFGTIMSYPGTKIPYYSNPSVNYGGSPTGVDDASPSSADNAHSLNNMVPFVAAWKAAVVPDSQTIEKISMGCFIATAAYGSDLHPRVFMLRKFRDRVLAQSHLGRRIIHGYYSVSPRIAQFLEDHPSFKPPVRFLLKPFSWVVEEIWGDALK